MPTIQPQHSAPNRSDDGTILKQIFLLIRDVSLLWVKGLVPLVNFLGAKIREAFCAYGAVDAWILARLPRFLTNILEASDNYARTAPVDFILFCVISPIVVVGSLLVVICGGALLYLIVRVLFILASGHHNPQNKSLTAVSQNRHSAYGSIGAPVTEDSKITRRAVVALYFVADTMRVVMRLAAFVAVLFLLRGIYVILDEGFCR